MQTLKKKQQKLHMCKSYSQFIPNSLKIYSEVTPELLQRFSERFGINSE